MHDPLNPTPLPEPTPEPAPVTNPDAITGAHGSHPVGTGVGAAAAGTAGAALGAVGGPVGALVGAAVGAIAGGLIGKGASELVFPTEEQTHWRTSHRKRPEYDPALDYDRDYAPAYRAGWAARTRNPDATHFAEAEADAIAEWEATKGDSRLSDERARQAFLAGWDRRTEKVPVPTAESVAKESAVGIG